LPRGRQGLATTRGIGGAELAAMSLQCLLRTEDLATNVTTQGLQECHSADGKPMAAVGRYAADAGRCRAVRGGDTLGRTQMHPHVSLERKSLRKALAADEAGVSSNSGVRDHVIVEVM